MDDLPAVGEFAEDQGEAAVRSFAGRQGQVPGAADEGRFRAEDFNTKIREIQLPHLVARAGVGGAITIERGLPSAGLFGVGEEREVGRIPVAGHEGVEVVMVPGVLLVEEDVLDGGAGVGADGHDGEENEHEEYGSGDFHVASVW